MRTYIPEKKQRGQRHWVGKEGEQQAVYSANRQRAERPKGKRLLGRRGELIERSFAHCYETGGMRRTHLRNHSNILRPFADSCGGRQAESVAEKPARKGNAPRFPGALAYLAILPAVDGARHHE